MISATQNEYRPDYIPPPGETLLEKLDDLGIPQAELARQMGRTKKMVNDIIHGKAPITPQTALQLERVVGLPARLWDKHEQRYRQHLREAYVTKVAS